MREIPLLKSKLKKMLTQEEINALCMLLNADVEEAYHCFRTALQMFRKKGDMTYLMNAFGMILVISYQTNDFHYINETVKHMPIERPTGFIESHAKPEQKEPHTEVKLLGEFTITQNGATISEKDWKTRKISGILKYILSERGRHVSRETLAAVFWPNSDAKAASASLRVALCEIRKCFTARGMPFDDEKSLIVESKTGFFINDAIKLKTDVDEFEALYRRAKWKGLNEEETEALLTKMLRLYKGDFLADCPYDDWASLRREHCRALFIEASHKLLRLYMQKGAYKKAEELLLRHMYIDPFDEKACSAFLTLCRLTGQQDRANSFLRLFEKRFLEEMGVMPDIAG